MNNAQRAMISWGTADAGGRQSPPIGPRYTTMVQFEEDPDLSKGAWSLVVDFDKNFKNSKLVLARVRFLAEEAPRDLLHTGSRFVLLEGKKRVGKGVILPAETPVPEEISEFEAALIG